MSHDHPQAGDEAYAGFRIQEIWAYTQVDTDDQEGIITLQTPNGPVPLIASDRVRLGDYKLYARMVANSTGRAVRLRRFTFTEDVDTLEP